MPAIFLLAGGTVSGFYRDLKAWQDAVELVVDVYSCTSSFPKEETYGLSSQLRRAAVSVACNIAEGKGRCTDKEFLLFLHHARGSAFEVETQLIIAGRLGYIAESEMERMANSAGKIARMLDGLSKAIRSGDEEEEAWREPANLRTPLTLVSRRLKTEY
jgi:four helix bundle protein